MARAGIVWTDRSLFSNLAEAPAKFEAAMAAFTAFWAPQVTNYARSNAPWNDQTGNARGGLKAVAESRPGQHSIILSHRMDYGIWLETRWSGRYAIILPTIKVMGHQVMGSLKTLMRGMG